MGVYISYAILTNFKQAICQFNKKCLKIGRNYFCPSYAINLTLTDVTYTNINVQSLNLTY